MTPCSFVCWVDDIFWPKRSGIICSERLDIIQCQPPNLALCNMEDQRVSFDCAYLISHNTPSGP